MNFRIRHLISPGKYLSVTLTAMARRIYYFITLRFITIGLVVMAPLPGGDNGIYGILQAQVLLQVHHHPSC